MTLNYEEWEGFGEETRPIRNPRRSNRKEKPLPEAFNPIPLSIGPDKDEGEIQKDSEKSVLRYIESRWGKLPPQEKGEKIKVYMRWVKDSLQLGYPILDEGDIRVTINKKSITLTHQPVLINAKEENRAKTTDLLYQRLEEHLKIWRQTSKEFELQMFTENVDNIPEVGIE